MPLPAIVAPLIGAAASVGSTLAGNSAARKEEQRAREWNEKMWHLQNAYNTPEEQMKRFKEAGLNPNLIYGKGTPGNAAQVSPAKAAKLQPFNVDPINDMLKYNQVENTQSQTNANNSAASLNNAKATAEAYENISRAEKSKIAPELVSSQLDILKADIGLKKLAQRTQQLDVLFKDQTLKNRVNLTRVSLENAIANKNYKKAEVELKNWAVELSKKGISPHDDAFWRLLSEKFTKNQLIKMLGVEKVTRALSGTFKIGLGALLKK